MPLRILVCALMMTVTGGCSTAEPSGSPPTIPAHQPSVIVGPTGTLAAVVKEPPTRAQTEVRLLRIEDLAGKEIVEHRYGVEPAELSEQLPVGRYRLISWVQDCNGACAGIPDDKLAAPTRICGVKVDVNENNVTKVAVDAPPDADCAMTIGA
jgi:hypothetical protein